MSLAFATFIAFVLIISALVYFIHLRRRIASEAYAKVGFDACDRSFLNHFVRLKNLESSAEIWKEHKPDGYSPPERQEACLSQEGGGPEGQLSLRHRGRQRVVLARNSEGQAGKVLLLLRLCIVH